MIGTFKKTTVCNVWSGGCESINFEIWRTQYMPTCYYYYYYYYYYYIYCYYLSAGRGKCWIEILMRQLARLDRVQACRNRDSWQIMQLARGTQKRGNARPDILISNKLWLVAATLVSMVLSMCFPAGSFQAVCDISLDFKLRFASTLDIETACINVPLQPFTCYLQFIIVIILTYSKAQHLLKSFDRPLTCSGFLRSEKSIHLSWIRTRASWISRRARYPEPDKLLTNVLYCINCIVLMGLSLLPNARRRFEILCYPNLDTRA